MSPQKNNNTCGCIATIVIAAVVIIAISMGGKTKKNTSTGTEFIGHDPQSYETAADLYSQTSKPLLTESEYSALSNQFDSFVTTGILPESDVFKEVLIKLDGASDLKSVNKMIEAAIPTYVDLMNATAQPSDYFTQTDFLGGNSSYEIGNFAYAAVRYTSALNQDAKFLDARNNLGLCELHMGNNFAAIMHFNLILAMSPNYLGAEQNLSVALEKIGLREEALLHANKVVKVDETLPMAQYNLGWFQTASEEYKAAERSYAAALKLIPTYSLAIRANTINKLANGEKLSTQDQKALSADELVSVQFVKPTSIVKTTSAKPLTTWVFWVLMSIAFLVQIVFTISARSKYNYSAEGWGVFSIIVLAIGVIVFAIFFKSSNVYSTILWILTILNILLLNTAK